MDFRTARFLTNRSQLDIESATKVFQTKLSRFEKNGIECLRDDEKKKIQKYLGFKINWKTDKGSPPLTPSEWTATKSFIDHFMQKDPKKTKQWMANYKTSRELHAAVMKVFNNTMVKVLGVRYPDGSGVPRAPKMKWDKQGKPDYSHILKMFKDD